MVSSDGEVEDYFGGRLSISADLVVVASQGKNVNGNVNQGQVYVFAKPVSGWSGSISEVSKLIASDGGTGDRFGTSVSFSDDIIVVGAPYQNSNGNPRQGKAYVYEKPAPGWPSTMFETTILHTSDGEASDLFGAKVCISENVVMIGAIGHSVNGNQEQGQAYIFVRNEHPSLN